MQIKSVTLQNFHGVLNKSYEFDMLNYLHGKNGAGKSSILQAIQLAILGYIPGYNKKKSDIFKHATGNPMSVKIYLDDGSSIERRWTAVKSDIIPETIVDPATSNIVAELATMVKDIELPIFNFSEFTSLTSNKMKDWFIQFLPSSESEIDWESELSAVFDASELLSQEIAVNRSNLKSSILDMIASMKDVSQIDVIRKLNDYFKQAKSFKTKEVERLQSTTNSLIYYDDVDMIESVDAINSKILDIQQMIDDYQKANGINLANEINKSKLDDLSKTYDADVYENDINYIKAVESQKDIQSKMLEISSKMEKLQLEESLLKKQYTDVSSEKKAKQSIVDSDGQCPYTTDKCMHVQSLIESYTNDILDLEKVCSNIMLKISDNNAQYKLLDSEFHILRSKKDQTTNDISTIIRMYREMKSLQSSIVDVNPIVLQYDVDSLKDQLTALIDQKSKILANEEYQKLQDTILKDKLIAQDELSIYKELVKLTDANGLQTKVIGSDQFKILSDMMNADIKKISSESRKVTFIAESKNNSFSFGLTSESTYVPYDMLSSGEKCIVAFVLMKNIIELNSSRLKILMVDDLFDHLDSDAFNHLFESLLITDIQMIFAGVNLPKLQGKVIEV